VILDDILRGVKAAELFLNFLNKNNKTDMTILKVTKVRSSLTSPVHLLTLRRNPLKTATRSTIPPSLLPTPSPIVVPPQIVSSAKISIGLAGPTIGRNSPPPLLSA